jgi:hypothetical protein
MGGNGGNGANSELYTNSYGIYDNGQNPGLNGGAGGCLGTGIGVQAPGDSSLPGNGQNGVSYDVNDGKSGSGTTAPTIFSPSTPGYVTIQFADGTSANAAYGGQEGESGNPSVVMLYYQYPQPQSQ